MAFPNDFPNKGAEPADDKKTEPEGGEDLKGMFDKAEADGKFAPLKDVLGKLGRDDITPKEVVALSAKEPRTRGKSPEEIASMIEADEGLLDDLIAFKPGGSLADFGKKKDEPSGAGGPPGMM